MGLYVVLARGGVGVTGHMIAIIRPGDGESFLGRYFHNKPDEQYQAFDGVDDALQWAEGLAQVDDFSDLEWVTSEDTGLWILLGSRH